MEVDDVIAHAVYDPVARRQRYLKNRQLKGRQKGAATPPPPKAGVGSRVVEAGSAASNVHANRTKMIQAASSARQVAAIQGRLNDLKAHLNELLAKKKAESKDSSSSDSKKSDSKDSKDTKSSDKPKTAKQKAAAKDALKKAQLERAKTQKAKPDKQEGGTSLSLDEQITKTRSVITDVETKLRTAIEQSRNQTASNGR